MEANILVVDDEPEIADLVGVYLKSEGFTTWKTTFRRQTWRTCEDSGLLPHSWEVKRMASISVSLDRNADRHDVKLLKRELDTLPGVTSVSVSSGGQLAVDYDATGVRQADILEKIQALGYHVRQEHA